MAKYVIITVCFYFLILFEASFLAQFSVFHFFPSISVLFIVLMNIFEKQNNFFGIFSALIGGFLLDVFFSSPFSIGFFGFYTIGLTGLAFFIKYILKKYLHVPLQYEF